MRSILHGVNRLAPVVVFVTLLCTGCGMEQSENSQRIQADLIEAGRAAQIGHTVEARKWADRAIAVDPNRMATYAADPLGSGDADVATVAAVFELVGDDNSIVHYMEQAEKRNPNSVAPLLPLAEAQRDLGDTSGLRATGASLVALLTKKLDTPGTMPSVALLNTLAEAYWDAGDIVKAASYYQRVITTFPNDSQAYNEIAYMWAVEDSKPNLPQALTDAQTAVRLATAEVREGSEPEDYLGLEQDTLGWVQFRLGDYKSALANVQAGADACPRVPDVHYHLAMVYLAEHDVEDARIELTRATLLDPAYVDAQRELESLPKATPAVPSDSPAHSS